MINRKLTMTLMRLIAIKYFNRLTAKTDTISVDVYLVGKYVSIKE